MVSRREDRIPVSKAIILTVLVEPERNLEALVKDVSPQGMGLVTSAAIQPGTPVKIETTDSILLGEAAYCRALDSGYFIGVHLKQVLTGLTALNKMAVEFEAQLRPRPRIQTAT
jgi:hypothetical protein